jgi:hypothetical protein
MAQSDRWSAFALVIARPQTSRGLDFKEKTFGHRALMAIISKITQSETALR